MDKTNWQSYVIKTEPIPAAPEKLRLLVYGETGVGKTRLLGTFPDIFVIDTDKGLLSVRDKSIHVLPLSLGDKAFGLILDVFAAIKGKTPPFDKLNIKTVGIDSIHELANILLWESMKYPTGTRAPKDPTREKPEFDHWGELRNRLDVIIRMSQDLGLNIVATCAQKLERDEITGAFIGGPNIQGSYRDVIAHKFDEVYYMTTQGSGDKLKYMTYTRKYTYFGAKSRLGIAPIIENVSYDELKKSVPGL